MIFSILSLSTKRESSEGGGGEGGGAQQGDIQDQPQASCSEVDHHSDLHFDHDDHGGYHYPDDYDYDDHKNVLDHETYQVQQLAWKKVI